MYQNRIHPMPEVAPRFSPDQIQAMRAARPLAELVADETLGYDSLAGDTRTLSTPAPDGTRTAITLQAPQTTEPFLFRTIWQPLLTAPRYAPYHRLFVIDTGNIGVGRGPAETYNMHYAYLIHRPADETVNNMGIIVTLPIHRQENNIPHHTRSDNEQHTLAYRPGRAYILETAGTQALLQTVLLALENSNT